MKPKSIILLTAALCGIAFAPAAMAQPAGDAAAKPKAPVAEAIPNKEIVLTVLADGKVMEEGKSIEFHILEEKLKKLTQEYPNQRVIIQGASSLPYQTIVTVIDMCRKAGVWNIGMSQAPGDAPVAPRATAGNKDEPEMTVITLQQDGRVKLGHEVMAVPQFAARMEELGKRLSRPRLRIVSDGAAPGDLAVRVLEILQKEHLEAPSLWKVSSDMLIRYEVFSIDPAKASAMRREKPTDGKFYADLVALLEKGEAAQESLMVVRCRSGQKATAESKNLEIYPTEWEPQPAGSLPGAQGDNPPKVVVPLLAEAFETRNTGEEIEVEPIRGENSRIIELMLIASHTSLAERTPWGKDTSLTEMPLFETQRVTTNANLTEGEPFLLCTMNPPPDSKVHANRAWFAFATASFVD